MYDLSLCVISLLAFSQRGISPVLKNGDLSVCKPAFHQFLFYFTVYLQINGLVIQRREPLLTKMINHSIAIGSCTVQKDRILDFSYIELRF